MFAYNLGQTVIAVGVEGVVIGIHLPEDTDQSEVLYSIKFTESGLMFSVPESSVEGVR